jgi:hypothetical protein
MTLYKNLLAGGTITALSCLLFSADLFVGDLRFVAGLKDVDHSQQQPGSNLSTVPSAHSPFNTMPGLDFVNDQSVNWRYVDFSARELSAQQSSIPDSEILTNELANNSTNSLETMQLSVENTFNHAGFNQTDHGNSTTTSTTSTTSIFPEANSPEARKLMKLDDDTHTYPPLQTTGQSVFAQQTHKSSPTAVIYHF